MKHDPSNADEPELDEDELATLEGIADADAGRVIPHEEVVKWLRTWGKPGEKPPPPEWFK